MHLEEFFLLFYFRLVILKFFSISNCLKSVLWRKSLRSRNLKSNAVGNVVVINDVIGLTHLDRGCESEVLHRFLL